MLPARVGRVALLALSTLAASLGLVACDIGPKDPGVIKVNYSTKPGDEAQFNWTVSVDGANPQNVASSTTGSLMIEGVSAGEHHVTLGSLPTLCTTGTDDRLVLVPSKDTARVAFAVRCTRLTGDVTLLVTTSGLDLDTDGYRVMIDGAAGPTVSASVAGTTVTLAKLAPGPHEVALSGVASNCTVSPSGPRTAIVVADAAVPLSIGVACIGSGVIADPVGDTLPNTSGNTAPAFDIVAVSAKYIGSSMTVVLRFRNALAGSTMFGFVDFDLDENRLTGVAPLMNSFGGAAPQGSEAQLQFQTGTTSAASVSLLTGGSANIDMVIAGDSIKFTIPLAALNDDGNLTITTIIGTTDRPTDFAPNTGVFVTHRPPGPALNLRAVPRPHRSASPAAPEPDRRAAPPRREWWQRPPA